MSMPPKEYEGAWEDILTHAADFAGQQVRVTVLPTEEPKPHRYQSMIDLFEERKRNPWTPEELAVFDEFEQFQKEHPFRLRGIEDES